MRTTYCVPLMDTLGVTVSAEEFHDAVNVAFRDFESECYDEVHRSMWESLRRQFDLLSDDVLEKGAPLPSELTMLDVGCGTGLASELLPRRSSDEPFARSTSWTLRPEC